MQRSNVLRMLCQYRSQGDICPPKASDGQSRSGDLQSSRAHDGVRWRLTGLWGPYALCRPLNAITALLRTSHWPLKSEENASSWEAESPHITCLKAGPKKVPHWFFCHAALPPPSSKPPACDRPSIMFTVKFTKKKILQIAFGSTVWTSSYNI